MGRLRGAAALAAVAVSTMAFAGSVQAATMTYDEGDRYFPADLRFTGSPGEANDLQVTYGASPFNGAPSIFFTDSSNPIVPSTDDQTLQELLNTCTFLPHEAICSADVHEDY